MKTYKTNISLISQSVCVLFNNKVLTIYHRLMVHVCMYNRPMSSLIAHASTLVHPLQKRQDTIMALNSFIKENVHYLSQVISLRMRQLRLPVPWSYWGGRDIWLPRETLDRECWVAEGFTKQTNKQKTHFRLKFWKIKKSPILKSLPNWMSLRFNRHDHEIGDLTK